MDQRTIQILFALLRSAICGIKLTEEELCCYTSDLLPQLLCISTEHDVVHLLAFGLKQNGLIPTGDTDIEQCVYKAAYRYEQLQYELENLCKAFETSQIPFLPLKGAVIQKYYPQAWMRISGDIDILIHKEDLEKAKAVLADAYGYTFDHKSSHDISLFTPQKMHIELHYDLIEDGRANASSQILQSVWDQSTRRDGYAFRHEMPDALFYFYHIAHMAKHFYSGGCGIRPFIDLWILDTVCQADREERDRLLAQGGLLKFANAARRLCAIWFENAQYDPVMQQMAEYILRGGVYGNDENRISFQRQKQGGSIRYALSRVFVPYEQMKRYYPIVQKHRWLTPFMQLRRWCALIFGGELKRITKELSYSSNITDTEAEAMQKLLENIGL